MLAEKTSFGAHWPVRVYRMCMSLRHITDGVGVCAKHTQLGLLIIQVAVMIAVSASDVRAARAHMTVANLALYTMAGVSCNYTSPPTHTLLPLQQIKRRARAHLT